MICRERETHIAFGGQDSVQADKSTHSAHLTAGRSQNETAPEDAGSVGYADKDA
jgi:hypothetical protein